MRKIANRMTEEVAAIRPPRPRGRPKGSKSGMGTRLAERVNIIRQSVRRGAAEDSAFLNERLDKIVGEAEVALNERRKALIALKEELEPAAMAHIIDAVGSGLLLSEACEELGVEPRRVRALLARDPEFSSAYFAARESGKQLKIDALVDIGLERAKDKSDLLYIFLMKALDPSTFNDRLVISGTGARGEMIFGTIADLVKISRLDRYENSQTAELVESKETEGEAQYAPQLRTDEGALPEQGGEQGQSGREGGEDLQCEDTTESRGASDGAELGEEGSEGSSEEGEGPPVLPE